MADNKENFDSILAKYENGDELNSTDATSLAEFMASTPWQNTGVSGQVDKTVVDEDGFVVSLHGSGSSEFSYANFQKAQKNCWVRFHNNPFVFTTVTDSVGRQTGFGFEQCSAEQELQDFIEMICEDPRNSLYKNLGKYVGRSDAQGELFLSLSLHKDGFVEVDFVDPTTVSGYSDNSGIICHSTKANFPLVYRVATPDGYVDVPSVNLIYYPALLADARTQVPTLKLFGQDTSLIYKKFGGMTTFITSWDRSFITKRNVGRVKTALEWIEHYEDIKKWELDHKKSSGAYLWTITIEDKQAFRLWLSMTDEQRAATGLLAKKTPGGTVMLPPGFSMTCNNPKLSAITDQDNDILRMISAGLNTAEDIMTGSSSGTTYSGAKMSRGPVSDRMSDSIADLERFLRFDFWRPIITLASAKGIVKQTYKVKQASRLQEGEEPRLKNRQVKSWKLIDINFPVSDMSNIKDVTQAMLGVNHGSLSDELGIPLSVIAKKIGFQNYPSLRIQQATEAATYPKTAAETEKDNTQETLANNGKSPAANTNEQQDVKTKQVNT